ncbi:hypothetical protein Rhal01_02009 [Rubritalea halochordaticola]|uniref:CHASE2 domain-containing protein n=1 Tax=Rubritalea halochordaticola TaxID=714537 RepID=A0ABP9V1I1_9BACT
MSIIRKAQLLILALTAGTGLAVLFTLDKVPTLSLVDTMLSPQESGNIAPGSIVEDPHPESHRKRVFRKVFAPNNQTPEYLLCSIDDDPDRINAYGLYHPADLSIALENLRQLKMRSIFITTHLQWPELDQVELNALSSAIGKFEHATIATPVKRSVKGDPIPDYFIRASLPASEVSGDSSSLPRVNQLSLAPNITIPQNTLAGFSQIESEEALENSIPLVARWDDRIIFYAPLLELLQHLGLTIDDLYIEAGQYIRLGNKGNIIPIDEFGHYKTDYQTTEEPFTVTAAYSGEVSMIGITQTSAILSADGEKSSVYSAISNPYNIIAQIAHTPTVGEESTLTRFPLWLEILLVLNLAALGAWLFTYRSSRRHTVFTIALFTTGAIIFVLNRFTAYWSPSAPYFLTLISAWIFTSLLSRPVRKKLRENKSSAAENKKTKEPATQSSKEDTSPAKTSSQKKEARDPKPATKKPSEPAGKPFKASLEKNSQDKKSKQEIKLSKPEKENTHTGKPSAQAFEEELIPDEATMFSAASEKQAEKKTNQADADDTSAKTEKSSESNKQATAPGQITSKVKIDIKTEYPFYPADSEDK